jgi:hypothetical protein
MMAGQSISRGQMANVAAAYAGCSAPDTRIGGDRAVVRYPVGQRACAPLFLVREDDSWRLDLTVMRVLVVFNTKNHWRLGQGNAGPYAFAFEDWRFDENGYPIE